MPVTSGRSFPLYLWKVLKRVLAPFVGFVFAAMLLAPSLVLLQFQVDRARIERELCVQRDLIEGMRTCHGECQLSKRFQALEAQAEAGFPTERVQVRYEPVVDPDPLPRVIIVSSEYRVMPEPVFRLAEGFGKRVEHVPRG
jgi:hypothetical protein